MSVIILFASFTCFIIVCYFSILKFVKYLELEKNICPKIKKINCIYKIIICLETFAGIFLFGVTLIKAIKLFPDLEQVILFCNITFILLTFYVTLTILYPIKLLELNLNKEI